MLRRSIAASLLLAAGVTTPLAAAPWASVGDDQLRSDLTLLNDAGIAQTMVTQWPVPWRGVLDALQDSPTLDAQPKYIQQAIRRVRARALRETAEGSRAETLLDATNRPALVRGFNAEGYGKGTIQETAEITAGRSDLHVEVGAIAGQTGQHGVQFDADGSYLAQRFGNVQLYAGEVTHWWGPGWASALTYSNNARPFPQLGIATAGPLRFKTPLLSWLGPFRAEALVGLLDDTRIAHHTAFTGIRVTLNPARGLEIGGSRTQILCGSGHPCSIGEVFDLNNNGANPSKSASEGEFDVRYGWRLGGVPVEVYTQIMNEDSNPITHSYSSYLVGGSVYIPVAKNTMRITAEYTSTISTLDLFSFGTVGYGISYTDYKYPDGLRYRGRDFGFSLDSDSRLYTLQANLTDSSDRNYTLSLHRALVSRPETGAANVLTPTPVNINYAEARVATPFYIGVLSVSGRVQDDQLRPAHGFTAAAEVTYRIRIK
jgi:hypothetical protein